MTDNGSKKAIHAVSGNAVTTIYQAILSPHCPTCGRLEQIIWVHCHGQCAHCHPYVMLCSDKSACEDLSQSFFIVAEGKNLTRRRYSLSTCAGVNTRCIVSRSLVLTIGVSTA